jgi:hypothetical protein
MMVIGGSEAWQNFDSTTASLWYEDSTLEHQPPGTAAARLQSGELSLHHSPAFSLQTAASWFCVGSCFARNVEDALIDRGKSVLSVTTDFDRFAMAESMPGQPHHCTNKYNVFSMVQSLRWAFGLEAFPEDAIVKMDGDHWLDVHSHHALGMLDRATTLELRGMHNVLTSRIQDADVLIVTLGLVETWVDRLTGLYLNSTPSRRLVELYPDRFQFSVTNHSHNLEAVRTLRTIVGQHSEARIVVTVSPVPLRATFTGRDVIVANSYSKSVLRSVAQEWVDTDPTIDYFPAFEIVTSTDLDEAYLGDRNHVHPSTVSRVISYFLARYGVDGQH